MGGEPEPPQPVQGSLPDCWGSLQESLAVQVTKTPTSTQQPAGTSMGPFNHMHAPNYSQAGLGTGSLAHSVTHISVTWSSHLTQLSLGLLLCNMGIIVMSALNG